MQHTPTIPNKDRTSTVNNKSSVKETNFGESVESYCREHRLFSEDENRVMRVPFLIKGEIRLPVDANFSDVLEAFSKKDSVHAVAGATAKCVQFEDATVLREPHYDRKTGQKLDQFSYQIYPKFTPRELMFEDTSALVDDLYNRPTREVLTFLDDLQEEYISAETLVERVQETTLQTAELPDFWHNTTFEMIPSLLNSEKMLDILDLELSYAGETGGKLLDQWHTIEAAAPLPTPIHLLADEVFPDDELWNPSELKIRAMPTRQLHVTAGNSPQIPIVSFLRCILTKSPSVVKLPYGATVPCALLGLIAGLKLKNRPYTKYLSIVYWQGGDKEIEQELFLSPFFDRIAVWGSPQSVAAVKKSTPFTKVVSFNPRYGASYIGKEAFENDKALDKVVKLGVTDSLVANQKACIASQIHYVEGDDEQIAKYAEKVQETLAAIDEASENILQSVQIGELKRLQRGKFIDADWFVNEKNGKFRSAAVVLNGEFNAADCPMTRVIIIRKVSNWDEPVKFLHRGVSTISLYPKQLKETLRDKISAAGVSNVMDLGYSGCHYPGASHDGMLVINELVDWKVSQ